MNKGSRKLTLKKSNKNIRKNTRVAKLCLTCNKRKFKTDSIIMESYKKPANWKKKLGFKTKFPGDVVPNKFSVKYPSGAKETIQINLGKTMGDRWVLYYAATPFDAKKQIKTPGKAYGSFNNQGMVKTNSDGTAIFKLKCPQRYREMGRVFPRHVHFLITHKDNKTWNNKLFTVGIRCS